MPLGKRRLGLRRPLRPGKPRSMAPLPAKPPKEVILKSPPPAPVSRSSDTETSLPAVGRGGVDPNAETEAAFGTEAALPVDAVETPMPPEKLPFNCPCGAKLSAPRAAFDKKIPCPKCGVKLLLNLIEDPHGGPYRLEPFQT